MSEFDEYDYHEEDDWSDPYESYTAVKEYDATDEYEQNIDTFYELVDEHDKEGQYKVLEIEDQEVVIKEYEEDVYTDEIIKDVTIQNEEDLEWTIKLGNDPSCHVNISEFSHQHYQYNPIFDPSSFVTSYYSCHCNINNETRKHPIPGNPDLKKWTTKKVCLSSNYRIANLEIFVKELSKEFEFNKSGPKDLNTPFVISWSGETSRKISVFKNEDHQFIFKLLSGNPDMVFSDVESKLNLSVLNSYDGTSSVIVDYNINLSAKDSNNKQLTFTDYFILNKFSKKVAHKSNIKELSSLSAEITNNITKELKIMRAYFPSDSEIHEISSKLRKSAKKWFTASWEMLCPDDKTLFYALLMLSKSLEDNYNAKSHMILRSIVNDIMKTAKNEYMKNESC